MTSPIYIDQRHLTAEFGHHHENAACTAMSHLIEICQAASKQNPPGIFDQNPRGADHIWTFENGTSLIRNRAKMTLNDHHRVELAILDADGNCPVRLTVSDHANLPEEDNLPQIFRNNLFIAGQGLLAAQALHDGCDEQMPRDIAFASETMISNDLVAAFPHMDEQVFDAIHRSATPWRAAHASIKASFGAIPDLKMSSENFPAIIIAHLCDDTMSNGSIHLRISGYDIRHTEITAARDAVQRLRSLSTLSKIQRLAA